jgi:hypothetical protein
LTLGEARAELIWIAITFDPGQVNASLVLAIPDNVIVSMPLGAGPHLGYS